MDEAPVGQTPGHGDGDGDGDAESVAGTETVDQRETDLAAREDRESERAAAHAARVDEARVILAEADKRDEEADERDLDADKRDMAANLHSWVHEDDVSGAGYDARQLAATDRSSARTDRTSSAVDRFNLAEDDDPRGSDHAHDEDPPDGAPPAP